MRRRYRQHGSARWPVGVAAGQPSKVIAADLGIAERTVDSHLGRMYDRYKVSNRVELLSLARRSGWV